MSAPPVSLGKLWQGPAGQPLASPWAGDTQDMGHQLAQVQGVRADADTHRDADDHRCLRSASGRPLTATQPYWLTMESTQAWGEGGVRP